MTETERTEAMRIIPAVSQLCIERRYDEAIAKTMELVKYDQVIAVKARLLCIEHEQNYLRGLA